MMDLALLRNKEEFPLHVLNQLDKISIDYHEKHISIMQSNSTGTNHLEAGVVLLLHYRNSEYVFQLIKRSDCVTQSGDISCPGGILERSTDEMLSHIVLNTGIIRTIDETILNHLPNKDDQTVSLIRLFLMNALREGWEEIGLSPLNVKFLGALPSYSLTYFSRTIFPVVCLAPEPYDFQLNAEVEKVLEIPLSYFFKRSSYAIVEIESSLGDSDPRYAMKFPCLVVPDDQGNEDILWGATFHIVTNFLRIISGVTLPSVASSRTVKKILSPHYASSKHE